MLYMTHTMYVQMPSSIVEHTIKGDSTAALLRLSKVR